MRKVMDSKENQSMGYTAGRSGAISIAIDQGKEVEVLWSCATEPRGIFGEGYSGSTMPGTQRRGRPRISWRDNIGDWTGMSMKEVLSSVQDHDRMTDGDELFTMQPNFGAKMVKDKTRLLVVLRPVVLSGLMSTSKSLVLELIL